MLATDRTPAGRRALFGASLPVTVVRRRRQSWRTPEDSQGECACQAPSGVEIRDASQAIGCLESGGQNRAQRRPSQSAPFSHDARHEFIDWNIRFQYILSSIKYNFRIATTQCEVVGA
uniref:Uncharacterized protein n=1 Tax=Ralstonia syzygii R24 TaxID=907261 RepID=G3A8Y8_9RALS|nr:conserved hypothetical protein [Ralstonia syzygii R24]